VDVHDERGEEMSDMISRDEVLAIIAELKKEYPTHSVPDAEAKVALRKAADKIRAIDAVSVVHGEWIVKQSGFAECSVCEESFFSDYNYCPNCGARMKGADDD